jgi:hypothetical protein
MPQKRDAEAQKKISKEKEIDVPLSQELIVNLLARMSEGILQLHSYSMPIRASPTVEMRPSTRSKKSVTKLSASPDKILHSVCSQS